MSNSISAMDSGILLVGVGNEFRRDDALGIVVAREISKSGIPGVTIIEHHGEGASLMDLWRNRDCVLVVDALSSGGVPGVVHRCGASITRMPAEFFHYSSHAFGLAEAIEMARVLQQLPPRLIVYGIVGKTFDIGIGLSDPVQQNLSSLLGMIAFDIQELRREMARKQSVTTLHG